MIYPSVFNNFWTKRLILLGVFCCFYTLRGIAQSDTALIAPVIPSSDTVFGIVLEDEYAWLRNRDSSQVRDYIDAENSHYYTFFDTIGILEDNVWDEVNSFLPKKLKETPYHHKSYWYYFVDGFRTSKYYRKKKQKSLKRELILSEREFIIEEDFYSVELGEWSPDEDLVALYVDYLGNFEFDVFFKRISSKELLPDRLKRVSSVVWCDDNQTLYYTQQDSITNRSCFVYRHILGTPIEEDVLLYFEANTLYDILLEKSKAEDFIFLIAEGLNSNEYRYCKADDTTGNFQVVVPRQAYHSYSVYPVQDTFYILSNLNTPNNHLIKTPVDKLDMEYWQEVIAHNDTIELDELVPFENHLVIKEWHNGLPKFRVWDWYFNTSYFIPLNGDLYHVNVGKNLDWNSSMFYYEYQSFTKTAETYVFDLETQENMAFVTQKLDIDLSAYVEKRIWCLAEDGARIPMSIVYSKDLDLNKSGGNPVFMSAYGAYGERSEVLFDPNYLSLVDRGFICVLAHVRGGGDLGGAWYQNGKFLKKKNSFTDFIRCAEYLIEQGYTSKGEIAIQGASAGGLLVGAVINMRPDLFKVAILDVPFVDVCNTMRDPTLPLTTGEYAEWGDPNDSTAFCYMHSYSPYDNVTTQNYPHLLFTTGWNDEQVGYWEPAKMVARLRARKTDANDLLFWTDYEGGHEGSSNPYTNFEAAIWQECFILWQFGYRE